MYNPGSSRATRPMYVWDARGGRRVPREGGKEGISYVGDHEDKAVVGMACSRVYRVDEISRSSVGTIKRISMTADP